MRPVWNPHPAMVLAGFAAAVPQPATALRPCEPAAAELVARLDAAVERPADEALAELDTLADLARRSDTTWLVPLTPRKPAGGVETLVPFAEAIAATRRAVWVAAASNGSRPSGELATAVADRDSARLAESLREARDPLTAAMAAAARGDLFGERGDPAAVDAWRMAAAIFASAGYPERAAKLEATAAAFTAATVREEAPLSRRLSPAWRSDFPRLAGESAGIEPVVSTGTIDGERLLIFAGRVAAHRGLRRGPSHRGSASFHPQVRPVAPQRQFPEGSPSPAAGWSPGFPRRRATDRSWSVSISPRRPKAGWPGRHRLRERCRCQSVRRGSSTGRWWPAPPGLRRAIRWPWPPSGLATDRWHGRGRW